MVSTRKRNGTSSLQKRGAGTDYFYDPNMHGVNWQAMRQRYGDLLKGR
jgi:hypothetical protein